jgi:hypothetical protein
MPRARNAPGGEIGRSCNLASASPNLFLIGAMKSGTTTLHELLAQHPEIAMCDPKEPCYFVLQSCGRSFVRR